ncbi:MAG: hypothetical protein U5K38_18160 [Woeseiaceae bacterium]|nr:hypothetical protein [Woeseiaceae bacterium]
MGDDVPLGALFGLLAVLLVLSAFFSGSETAFDEPEPLSHAPQGAQWPSPAHSLPSTCLSARTA